LVQADQELGQGGWNLDMPELLAAGAAAHQSSLANVRRDQIEAQHGVAHHRRDCIKRAGDQADHGAETEEQQEGNEIGEGRHGLHQVEACLNGAPQSRVPVTERAEAEANHHGDRHCEQDQ
jgi:hypothetical protein